jgi:hypothetical protein
MTVENFHAQWYHGALKIAMPKWKANKRFQTRLQKTKIMKNICNNL